MAFIRDHFKGDGSVAAAVEDFHAFVDVADRDAFNFFPILLIQDDEAAHGRPVDDVADFVAFASGAGFWQAARPVVVAHFPIIEVFHGKRQGKLPQKGEYRPIVFDVRRHDFAVHCDLELDQRNVNWFGCNSGRGVRGLRSFDGLFGWFCRRLRFLGAFAAAGDGEIVLLENVRFNAAETSKDDAEREAFAAELAALADVFVSDGFGVVHRKQASVYDVAKLLPSAAGLLVVKEIESLGRAVNDPERPYTVVLGGSKVSDKLGVISNLLGKADRLLIGGGMAYTFLAAQGYEVGTSLLEKDQIDTVKGYLETAKANGVELLLPVDTVVAPTFAADAPATVVPADALPADQMGLDIGPKTRELFADAIATSKTVVWNGPMGVFEFPAFAEGTKAVAKAISESDAFSVIGGGDSAAAVRTLGFDEATFSHISTGGGASLELLEGKTLPGIAVLND